MTANIYSPESIAWFLESLGMPRATAWSRAHELAHEQLNFRGLYRKVLKKLQSHQNQAAPLATLQGVPQMRFELSVSAQRTELPLPRRDNGDAAVLPPMLARTQFTPLNMALKLGALGPQRVLQLVEQRWSHRHDVDAPPANPCRTPRRRGAIDRLRLALLNFVAGIFGSHKVDARNNL